MPRHLLPVLFLALLVGCAHQSASSSRPASTPVILDTDIGNDIDDTYALMYLLRCPDLDLKLVTTTDGQPEYRARLVAKLLTAAGRADVPVALGPAAGKPTGKEKEAKWVADFQLSDYRGKVERDGVQALIDAVHASPTPVTIVAIGPLQTLAAALERDPSIARHAHLVGMQGSVFKGYGGKDKADPEFNVKLSVKSAQKVLSAPWLSAAITPLDTCGLPQVSFDAPRFAALKQTDTPVSRAIVASYAAWQGNVDPATLTTSTTLYDCVAIYLARPKHPLLVEQNLKITVTDEGITAVSPDGSPMSVATSWTDIEPFRDELLRAITR